MKVHYLPRARERMGTDLETFLARHDIVAGDQLASFEGCLRIRQCVRSLSAKRPLSDEYIDVWDEVERLLELLIGALGNAIDVVSLADALVNVLLASARHAAVSECVTTSRGGKIYIQSDEHGKVLVSVGS